LRESPDGFFLLAPFFCRLSIVGMVGTIDADQVWRYVQAYYWRGVRRVSDARVICLNCELSVDENTLNSRLSRISTVWTILDKARRESGSVAADAHWSLIRRYQRAVYRYLLGALRDPDAADEVFQDFALRVVQGAFRRADPQRGRFRDYLKTTLIHLIADYRNRLRNRPAPLDKTINEPVAQPCDPAAADERFLHAWREELLARAWESLENAQRRGGQPYYSVLRFRAENADASSAEMADRLTQQLKPESPFTDAGIRKTLQRAKARFAELLLDEIVLSLDNPSPDELEQELIDLELLPHCRSAFNRRRHNG
jgi:RNA polymerase sigma factor (sigma-70 family)